MRAVLGLPTRLGTPVGTLNVYCERPRAWDESEIAALEAYNALLEARLAGALVDARTARSSTSCSSRSTAGSMIERAIGLLMGRDGLDNVAAFKELRRNARSSRRRVLDGRRRGARRAPA